jgi:hypothetical protein
MKFSKLSKILIVVLLVSVLAISLIACSTSKNNKDEKQSIDSSSSTLMATEPNSAAFFIPYDLNNGIISRIIASGMIDASFLKVFFLYYTRVLSDTQLIA